MKYHINFERKDVIIDIDKDWETLKEKFDRGNNIKIEKEDEDDYYLDLSKAIYIKLPNENL